MKGVLVKVGKVIGTWLPTGMLIYVFSVQGFAKFSTTSGWARAFQHWGYPAWFQLTIGTLEMLAALLLVLPMTAAAGAAIVMVVMLGGYGTHIVLEHRWSPQSEMVPFIFATIVFLIRRKKLVQLVERVRSNRSDHLRGEK
jgi:putative oxidoreductase